MANPQIRIIELPQDYNLSTTFGTDFIPVESAAEGGRKITVYDFFNTAGGLIFYLKTSKGGTERAIATYNSATSALYDNPNTNIDSSGSITAPSFRATSSQRYKTDIQDLLGATELVKQLRGVTFKWSLEPLASTIPTDIGLIAEEVNAVVPAVVGKDAENNPNSVDYSRLVAILINAIKELEARIVVLENK